MADFGEALRTRCKYIPVRSTAASLRPTLLSRLTPNPVSLSYVRQRIRVTPLKLQLPQEIE
jgi:hypothetical protein